MRVLRFVPLIVVLCFYYVSFSQTGVCGFDIEKEHLLRNPGYAKRVAAAEIKINQRVSAIESSRAKLRNFNILPGAICEVPVVVHVIRPSGNPVGWVNPSDQQIKDAIDTLNANFAATSALTSGHSPSIPIKFTLAKRTQNCVASNGIVRVSGSSVPSYDQYGVLLFGDVPGADIDAIRSLSYWPSNMVYNIWIVWKIAADVPAGTYITGYADLPTDNSTFPFWPVNIREGMIILASQFINLNTTTLTHEMGHAFGLFHTFQDGDADNCPPPGAATNCATEGDRVCDTDPVKNLLLVNGCAIDYNDPNPCNNNQPFQFSHKNIMGYGGCLDRFTGGQSTRMLATLDIAHAGYKTSLASVAPPPTLVKANTTQVPHSLSETTLTDIGPCNVTLGSLTYQSYGYYNDGAQYYLDNTCNFGTNLSSASAQELSVTTKNDSMNRQVCRAWIDFNNNGSFESEEMVLNSTTPDDDETLFKDYYTHKALIPAATLSSAVKYKLLRMRVMADYFLIVNSDTQPPNDFGPGSQLQYGQTEDFWVSIEGVPLPVIFADINASLKNENLNVKWGTESETNNDHFLIEGSADGEYFFTLAKVNSKALNGTSATALQYEVSIGARGALLSVSAIMFIIMCSTIGYTMRRKLIPITLLVTLIAFFACKKYDTERQSNGSEVKYVRIVQVNKDGAKQYSKVVKVIEE